MSAHTPGPWRVSRTSSRSANLGVYTESGLLICRVTVGSFGERSKADAALLATAPELLAALREMIFGADAMGWDTEKARAAIAKAMGWDTGKASAAIAKATKP